AKDRTFALVGPALHDVREVMVEGPSGLKAQAPGDNRPRWEAGRRRLATLSNLRFGLRLGADPKLAITTTPRPIPALRRLLAEPGVVKARLATKDNAAHLAPGFLGHLQALYAGTRLEAQEMEGLVVEADGALFRVEDLARARGGRPAKFERVVVAVDPPASAHGDACGIVVAGRKD
uniref:FAD_binding_3 domain-containing protein n=1 Tax=Parastrongyloides trichosuri TaxID=131310 RepID=A0A0N4ZLY2_PARTI